jgi:hypothetical protein
MRRVFGRVALLGLVAGYAVLAASCTGGPQRFPETGATLEGTVSLGTEQVPFAMIIVVSQDGKESATGKIEEDGRYKVTNAPLGEVKVAVNTDAGRGDYQSRAMAASYKGPDKVGKKPGPLPNFVEVPKKYQDPQTSGLKTTVNKGSNTYDIVIPK